MGVGRLIQTEKYLENKLFKMISSKCLALLLLVGTLHLAQGREYVGGLAGLKDRIQKQSKEDLSCKEIIEMVFAALDTNDINVPECFNLVNELSRSPPQPKPEKLDPKCLENPKEVCGKPNQQYLGAGADNENN